MMAAKSRWLGYALCCAFIAACGGNDSNDTGAAPTSTQIANQTINQDTATAAIPFTVGDADTAATSLTVSGSSSNTTLVPSDNTHITFGGSGTSRTITVTPAAGQTGTSTITYSVSDGTHTTSKTFVLTVSASSAKTIDTPQEGAALAAAVSNLFNQVSGTSPAGKAAHAKIAVPCSDGGTFDSTSDDTTTFAGDGTFMFSDCVNTDQSSGDTVTLDGQFVYKCTDPQQNQSTCSDNDSDITLGQVSTPFSAHVVNSPSIDVLGQFYSFLVSLTDNGDQQTDSLSLDGRVVLTDNSTTANCGSGDVTVETVHALTVAQSDTSQITGGELNLTAADNSTANVVFNADGSETVTVNGVGQTYTAQQLAAICTAGG